MSRIQQLEEAVYARIAAGEVIVSPAAAVKELIENAIDAGSTGITVEIQNGGKELIRVTDNGMGMSADDLPLSIARHATSKINTFDDVYSLGTLGFRGEALASIAEISRLSIVTRQHGAALGSRLVVAGGGSPSVAPAGAPEGTTVRVEDLFYNVPARHKFLKTGGREGALVSEAVRRALLSAPDVALKFIRNRKVVYQSAGTGDILTAAGCVYGPECLRELLEVRWETEGCTIEGCVSRPTYIFKTAQRIDFFVNGRYIQSKALQKALMRGYGESMLHGHYPCAILNIRLSPDTVDVNVHPAKLTAMFRDEQLVQSAVMNAVQKAVGTSVGAPQVVVSPTADSFEETKSEYGAGSESFSTTNTAAADSSQTKQPCRHHDLNRPQRFWQAEQATNGQVSHDAPTDAELPQAGQQSAMEMFAAFVNSDEATEKPPAPEVDVRTLNDIRILGSAFATYIVVEAAGRLFFIDQHAARERLTYEKLLKWIKSRDQYAQLLLVPVVRTFQAPDFMVLQENKGLLEKLGICFEEFGELTMRFFSFPVQLGAEGIDAFLSDILAELQSHPDDPIAARDRVISSACRHSVKGGTQLTEEEMKSLVREITSMDAIPFCPHGRPIAVEVTREQLEKGFRRRT